MTPASLIRVRKLVAEGAVTLTDVVRDTGIPAATLWRMLQPGWQDKTFQRLRQIDEAVARMDRAPPRRLKKRAA